MLPMPLIGDYVIEEMSPQEFGVLYTERVDRYFQGAMDPVPDEHFTDEEREQIATRRKATPAMLRFQWRVKLHDDIIGWTYCFQTDAETLYMCNTAIDPQHQRRGVYTALLAAVMQHAKDLGFQVITSRHKAWNNAVIIPKLKAGFIVSGVNISERFGMMVHLTYCIYEARRKAMMAKIG